MLEFLRVFRGPISWRTRTALLSWTTAEGTTAKFNPLATTRQMPGATDFNTTHVKNYVSLEQGLEATFLTIQESGHNYEPIRHRIRENRPAERILTAVEHSAWGTGGLGLRVLPSVQAHYWDYANKLIGQ